MSDEITNYTCDPLIITLIFPWEIVTVYGISSKIDVSELILNQPIIANYPQEDIVSSRLIAPHLPMSVLVTGHLPL